MTTHYISAEHLSIERIGEIIKNGEKLELSDDASIQRSPCLWCDDRLRFALQRVYWQGSAVTATDKPHKEPCLRCGRASAKQHSEDNAAAEDSVVVLRLFRL